ncbi:hypothetical protein MINT15_40320 [Saccharomonospora viridis]|uniref:Uncharacterized protein n=1 Tax=Saccharomonospora viridis TaxID=1852 RepID=A0A837D8X0_9PSEU|nr:hypothetical protein MINT15_40320 [Saccharomonospora viridis]
MGKNARTDHKRSNAGSSTSRPESIPTHGRVPTCPDLQAGAPERGQLTRTGSFSTP